MCILKREESGLGRRMPALEQVQGREGHCQQEVSEVLRFLAQEMKPQVTWAVMGLKLHLVGTGARATLRLCLRSGNGRHPHPAGLPLESFPCFWGRLALCCLFQASADSFLIKMEPKGGTIRYLILTQSERTPDVSFCLKVRGRKSN